MLRDPELHEAHEALQNTPRENLSAQELGDWLHELTSVTMLLLRVVDRLAEDQDRIRDLGDLIAKHQAYLTKKIDDLQRT